VAAIALVVTAVDSVADVAVLAVVTAADVASKRIRANQILGRALVETPGPFLFSSLIF
jgi:hypothetical protein